MSPSCHASEPRTPCANWLTLDIIFTSPGSSTTMIDSAARTPCCADIYSAPHARVSDRVLHLRQKRGEACLRWAGGLASCSSEPAAAAWNPPTRCARVSYTQSASPLPRPLRTRASRGVHDGGAPPLSSDGIALQ